MEKNRNKQFKVAVTLLTLAASMLLAGCQGGLTVEPSTPGEQVIKDGIKKLTEVTSYGYDVALKGDVKDETAQQVKFDLKLIGQVDIKDTKSPVVTLALSGSAGDGTDVGAGSLEMRLNKEALYFNVMQLTAPKSVGELPKEVTDMLNKWWKYPLEAGMTDELAKSLPQGDEANLTPEQLEIKKAMEATNFFGKPKFIGNENIKGEDSYHYSVTLDRKATLDFLKKVGEIQGSPISESESADVESGMAKVDVSGDIYVGTKTGVMNKLVANIKLNGTAAGEPSGAVSVTMILSDINKPVTLQVPPGTTDFPLEQFMGAMMGGAVTGDVTGGADLTGVDGLQDPSLLTEPAVEVQ